MVAFTTAIGTAASTAAPVVASSTNAGDSIEQAKKANETTEQGQRTRLNGQILQASLEVSVKAGDDSMALLYRSAIDHINELLAPEFGPDALQAAMQQDNSAEATAGRIVSLSTAFFDRYAAQHADEDPETMLRNFVDLIRGGFEQGYGEAFDILQGLGVMGEDSTVAEGIRKTYELVHKGYDDFLATRLAALKGAKDGEGETAAAAPAKAGDKAPA